MCSYNSLISFFSELRSNINAFQLPSFARNIVICLGLSIFVSGCSQQIVGKYSYDRKQTSLSCPGTIQDVDGNSYTTVGIEDQCWMAENLRTAHYNDNTKIEEAYLADKDDENGAEWGRLYTWNALNKDPGVCPMGWHIATDDDYRILEMAMGMDKTTVNDTGWRRTGNESRMLKKFDNAYSWTEAEKKSINSSGFSAIPSGARTKIFGIPLSGTGTYGDLWTSTSISEEEAWSRTFVWTAIHPGIDEIRRAPVAKDWAFAVRCVKDK